MVNTAHLLAVMEDTQVEVMVQEVTLLVAEEVDSFVCSLLILLMEEKFCYVLVPAVAVATVSVELVAVKSVEMVMVEMANLLVDRKLLVVLEDQVHQANNSKEETVIQEDNKTSKPWMAEEVVPVTSVAKAVLLMLEVALVVQDTVTLIISMTVSLFKVTTVQMLIPSLQWLMTHGTKKVLDGVPKLPEMVAMVSSSLTSTAQKKSIPLTLLVNQSL